MRKPDIKLTAKVGRHWTTVTVEMAGFAERRKYFELSERHAQVGKSFRNSVKQAGRVRQPGHDLGDRQAGEAARQVMQTLSSNVSVAAEDRCWGEKPVEPCRLRLFGERPAIPSNRAIISALLEICGSDTDRPYEAKRVGRPERPRDPAAFDSLRRLAPVAMNPGEPAPCPARPAIDRKCASCVSLCGGEIMGQHVSGRQHRVG